MEQRQESSQQAKQRRPPEGGRYERSGKGNCKHKAAGSIKLSDPPLQKRGGRNRYTASRACSKSARRSRQCSMPTDTRTRPSVMPACANSFSLKPECVVVFG